jgi:hypothetical protein
MRVLAILSVVGVVGVGGVLSANGVQVWAPTGWHRVASAGDGPVDNPRTVLVVGTSGVRARLTVCQIAAYRIPPDGAVVVVVGWKPAKGISARGRIALAKLTSVRRPSFECFKGRGAAAQVELRGRVYQVNVMVGDRASKQRIGEALDVARSFNLER